jgi:hypothetical protein
MTDKPRKDEKTRKPPRENDEAQTSRGGQPEDRQEQNRGNKRPLPE